MDFEFVPHKFQKNFNYMGVNIAILENPKFDYDIKSLTVEALQHIKKGQYITFGAYEQDNNTLNGKEPLTGLSAV